MAMNTQIFSTYLAVEACLLKVCYSWDLHMCFQERNMQFLILGRTPPPHFFKLGEEDAGGA